MENICLNARLAGNEKNWEFIGDKNWRQDHTRIIYPPVCQDPLFDTARDKVPDLYAHELAREDYAFLAHILGDTDLSAEYKCQYGSVARISPASAMTGMIEADDGKVFALMREGYRMPGWIRGQFFRIAPSGPKAAD